jgi:hypothetical protein
MMGAFKMEINHTKRANVSWIYVAQHRDKWRHFVNKAIQIPDFVDRLLDSPKLFFSMDYSNINLIRFFT